MEKSVVLTDKTGYIVLRGEDGGDPLYIPKSNLTIRVNGDVVILRWPSDGRGAPNVVTLDYNSVDTPSVSNASDLVDQLYSWVSSDTSTGEMSVQNPEWAHYTDPDHVVDEADVDANTYFVALPMLGFRDLALQIVASDNMGISFKVYKTLDADAAVPSTGGSVGSSWHEITSDLFGGAVSGTSIDAYGKLSDEMAERVLIEYHPTDTTPTNSIDVWAIKY